MKKKLTLYACGIDWQHECGEGGAGDVIFYESIKVLKHKHHPWQECGIVKITGVMEEVEWPAKQALGVRRGLLTQIEDLLEYSLGPTRDVKTPKLEEALRLIKEVKNL